MSPAPQDFPVTTVSALLARQLAAHGDAVAFVDGERSVTVREFDAMVRHAADWLRTQGVGPGDRVAVWLVNRMEWLALFFGLARLGAALMTVNTRYRSHELAYILERSQPSLLVLQLNFRKIDFPAVLRDVPLEAAASLRRVAVIDAGHDLPDTVLGNLHWMGGYNFDTAVVTWSSPGQSGGLPAATNANRGSYFIAQFNSPTGTGTLNGTSYSQGDWLVSYGAAGGYQKVDNTDAVQSVAGRTGTIVLSKADVGLGSVDNTSDAGKPLSQAATTALAAKQDALVAGANIQLSGNTISAAAVAMPVARETTYAAGVALGVLDANATAGAYVRKATSGEVLSVTGFTNLALSSALRLQVNSSSGADTFPGLLSGVNGTYSLTINGTSTPVVVTNYGGTPVAGTPVVYYVSCVQLSGSVALEVVADTGI